MPCEHAHPYLECSPNASVMGYKPRTLGQIALAAGYTFLDPADLPGVATYPQPLVLPEDDLNWDPQRSEQTLSDTKLCANRVNREPGGRHVIYVVRPPRISRHAPKDMKNWTQLRLPKSQRTNLLQTPVPQTNDVIEYLSAFYYGLPVKILPGELSFTSWNDESDTISKKSRKVPQAIGLQTSEEIVRIRCRPKTTGPYAVQLNLDDLLDVAIAIQPPDAYAVLMLIEHDMYEHEEDEFCCGRAYGRSRIACVSMARYHPAADVEHDVDLEHAWPASHCAEFVERMLQDSNPDSYSDLQANSASEPTKKKAKKSAKPNNRSKSNSKSGAMHAAINAYPKNLDLMTLDAYAGLWLGRLCRTASHELGHCFGMDHCVYYACAMQGTSSVAEDMRQPPYLCPVDLVKLSYFTGTSRKEHHEALLKFCNKYQGQHGALFWTPFEAWLTKRLSLFRK